MEATTRAPGRPRDPRRDTAILDAVLELIAEVGYDQTTIDAIAARAGVGKPTIYRRWPGGKRDVVVAAMQAKSREFAPPEDTGSLRGDLMAMARQLIEHFQARSHLAGGLLGQLRASEEFRHLFREHVMPVRQEWLMTPVDRAIARGELPADPPVTPLYVNVAPSLTFARSQFDLGPLDETYVEELVDRILLPILRGDHAGGD
jgi:AcrR family transcriptional regulator